MEMKIQGKIITIPERGLSTEEIAKLFNVKKITVQKFAQKNNVSYNGEGYRKNYYFFENDIINFSNRPKRGRRWEK
jgi:orotate phosphoribosyltransferase-like protein